MDNIVLKEIYLGFGRPSFHMGTSAFPFQMEMHNQND